MGSQSLIVLALHSRGTQQSSCQSGPDSGRQSSITIPYKSSDVWPPVGETPADFPSRSGSEFFGCEASGWRSHDSRLPCRTRLPFWQCRHRLFDIPCVCHDLPRILVSRNCPGKLKPCGVVTTTTGFGSAGFSRHQKSTTEPVPCQLTPTLRLFGIARFNPPATARSSAGFRVPSPAHGQASRRCVGQDVPRARDDGSASHRASIPARDDRAGGGRCLSSPVGASAVPDRKS